MKLDFKRMTPERPQDKVGLDIGSGAVKIAWISGHSEKPVLKGLGMKDIAGVAKNDLAATIAELAAHANILTKEVAISVSGPSVIVRLISMPKMDMEALRNAVKFEAEKFIPFNINDCIVDFQIVEQADKDNKLKLLLVAVKKEHVTDKIKLVEAAGFLVKVVDIDSFAMTNAFLKNLQTETQDKTCALLNIGASSTNLSIFKGGSVYFARDVGVSGNDFITAVSNSLGVDPKAAEGLLTNPGEKLQEVIDCTKVALSNLIEEAKLSFNYYENQGGRSIDEIYASGGGSGIPGLSEAFVDVFSTKLSLWDPFRFLEKDPVIGEAAELDKSKKFFGVAIGLALR